MFGWLMIPAFLALLGGSAQAQTNLVGQWATNYNGQQLVLTLNADGSAVLMGARGTWQAANGAIVMSNAQGQIQGAVRNGQLVFDLNGQQFVYTRLGAGAAPAPEAPVAMGKPFKPKKTLPGHKVTPEQTQMSFTIPNGWTGAWTPVGNQLVYLFNVPGMQGKAMIGATAKVLGPERNLPMATLLQQGAILVWGQAAAGAPHLSETFTVNGRPAGRIIYRATLPHPATGQMTPSEGYMGLVVIDDWAIGFVGLYEEAQSASLRPAMDTMLASLSGTPPPRNRQMEAQIAGCWESGTGTGPSTKQKGSAFTSAYIRIAPNGTYRRSGGVSVSTPTLDSSKPDRPEASVSGEFGEQGTFMVHGSLITWLPNGGGSYSNMISWTQGGLYLDKKLWITCI
jgi:hypothetical protein